MFNYLLMEEGASTGGGDWTLLIILGVFIIGMLAFSIIPQRRKQKQMAEMNSRIKVGDKIKTIGGLYGTIVDYNEENNVFTILSGSSTFEIDRGCVYSMEMVGAEQTAAPAEVKEIKEKKEKKEEKEEKLAEEKVDEKKEEEAEQKSEEKSGEVKH